MTSGQQRSNVALAVRLARIGLWDWELGTDRVAYSPEWKAQLGYAEHEIADRVDEWDARVHPDDLPGVRAQVERFLSDPQAGYRAEFRMRHKNGSWRWILSQADLVRDDDGRPVRMAGSHIDVTPLKASEAELRRSNRALNVMRASNRALLEVRTSQALFAEVCRLAVETGGYRMAWIGIAEDDEARTVRPVAWHGDDHGYLETVQISWSERTPFGHGPAGTAIRTGRCHVARNLEDLPDFGPWRQAASSRGFRSMMAVPLSDGRGLRGALSLYSAEEDAFDVAEERLLVDLAGDLSFGLRGLGTRRALEESLAALRASEERLARAQAVARLGSWELDPWTGAGHWSAQMYALFARDPALGPPAFEEFLALVHPGDRVAVSRLADDVVRRRAGAGAEFRVLLPAGVRWMAASVEPALDASGAVARLLGTAQDITERRLVEASLRQSEERFSAIVRTAMDAIVSVDEHQRIVLFNPAAERMFGYTADQLMGQPLDLLIPDAHRSAHREHIRRFGQTGDTSRTMGALGTIHGRRATAEQFPIEAAISQTRVGDGPLFTVILRDVTEREKARQTLLESEERFRQVTESIDDVFWLTDVAKQSMIYVSPAYERIWGRSCADLHASPESWMDAIHPDDRPRVANAARTRQVSGTYDVEYRIVRPDGQERWIHDRAFPVRDEAGRIARVAGVAKDITASRDLEEQLRQAQKMEAIGQLAGGVAHDFNNLLSVILMQSSLLLTEAEGMAAGAREGVNAIASAAERAASLTRQLLAFSRRTAAQKRNLDLADVLGTMTRLLARVIGEGIAVTTHWAPDLPLVHADAGMMEQVLMNLAVNARDAMPAHGELRIGLDARQLAAPRSTGGPPAVPGTFIRLTVADTGSGIAPEHLSQIFDPFFTTKEPGRGTGLGLATVFGIVQQHGGWIDVHSTLGRGTTFEVWLPAVGGAPGAAPRPAMEPMPTGTETVLLVEDDNAVRMVARAVLERCGYTVLEASTGPEGLRLAEAHAGTLDLLLTDLVMPGGLSGWQLADAVRARAPGLAVVYTSGYTVDEVMSRITTRRGQAFIQKPYRIGELARLVRRCLDER